MELDWMQILGWLAAAGMAVVGIAKVVIPYLAKEWAGAKRDQQEFEQSQHGDAFKQSLTITDTLVKFFIETIDKEREQTKELIKAMDELKSHNDRRFETIIQFISGAKTEISISRMDKSRFEEVLSDIDLELHEIKGAVGARSTERHNE